MDEILYLESDEEITSVIDKIKQSPAKRLGLVVSREATILQSVVNLKLLVKEAVNLGKEISLITTDRIGRNLAAKVGLPVYDSVKNQQPVFQPPPPVPSSEEVIEIDARKTQPIEKKPKGVSVHHFQEPISPPPRNFIPKVHRKTDWSKARRLLWPMLVMVSILILIGAFLILPKVKVKLSVKAEDFQKTFDSQISGSQNSTSIDNKVFAGEMIDLSAEKEETFPATGKKNLGGKASGTITIYNNVISKSQSLSAGTKFSSSSKTFILKSAVEVSGAEVTGTVQNPQFKAGTANAEIEAENPGEDYNVSAGRFTIVGLSASQQEAVYGQSSKDLTGGFSKEVQVVSQTDYNQAKAKLAKEVTDVLQKELEEKSAGLVVLDQATQIDPVEEKSSAKVDEEADSFTLKIKERSQTIVFSRVNFDKFILTTLEKQLPYDKMISLGPNDSILPKVKERKYDQNVLILEINATAKISSRIDTERVKDSILGKNQTEAQNLLGSIDGLAGAELSFYPAWWPIKRIPNFKQNVVVNLDYLEVRSAPTPPAEVTQ